MTATPAMALVKIVPQRSGNWYVVIAVLWCTLRPSSIKYGYAGFEVGSERDLTIASFTPPAPSPAPSPAPPPSAAPSTVPGT